MSHGGVSAGRRLAHGDPAGAQTVVDVVVVERGRRVAERRADAEESAKNAGRVLLLASGNTASYRGFFRLLTEEHIPFVVSENLRWLEDGSRYDLVIAPGAPPPALEGYVRQGGRLLVAGTAPPPLPIGAIAGRRSTQGYWRIHDRSRFPSLKDTSLIFIDGEYLEIAPLAASAPHADPDGDVRSAGKGLERQDRDDGAGSRLRESRQGQCRLHSVGRRWSLLPSQLGGPSRSSCRRDRSPVAGRTPAPHRRPPAGRDDPDGAAGAAPIVDSSGQRDRAPGHGLLSAGRDPRHPHRTGDASVRRVQAVALGRTLPIEGTGRRRWFTLPRLQAYEVLVVE